MLLAELTATSQAVRATPARTEKIERLAETLRRMGPDEVADRRRLSVGRAAPAPDRRGLALAARAARAGRAGHAELVEVDAACEAIGALAGPGSQAARRDGAGRAVRPRHRARAALPRRAADRRAAPGRAGGRHGRGGRARGRRAARRRPPRADAARRPRRHGRRGARAAAARRCARSRLQVGRPIQPMLAAPATDVGAALERDRPAAVECKLDGARMQVHRRGDEVRVFTRSLDDITARVPEVVEAALALPARELVLDGEAIALRADGRPHRSRSRRAASAAAAPTPREPADAVLLRPAAPRRRGPDRPPRRRAARRRSTRGPGGAARAARVIADAAGAQAFLETALAAGHEGVLVKALDAPYAAGRRGAGWLKVKPRPHARPRRAGRRMGPRPPPRLAEQPAPRRARRRRRVRHARQDVQGPDRRDARPGRPSACSRWRIGRDDWTRPRPPRAGGRDRLRRRPDQHALPGRRRRCASRASCATGPTRSAAEADTLDAVLAVHAAGA